MTRLPVFSFIFILMKLGKLKIFLVLNGAIVFFILIYVITWITAEKTTARVIPPYASSRVTAVYQVNGKVYTGRYLRNDISFRDKHIPITYLAFRPSSSRVYSFFGIAAEPLGWWLVFLLASAMLLFTDNPVFSKGTVFRLHKKFPWISMEELPFALVS